MTSGVPPIRVPGPAAPLPRCEDCREPLAPGARFCAACGRSTAPGSAGPIPVSIGIASGFRFGVGFFLAAAIFGAISFLVSLLVAGTLVGALLAGATGLGTTGAHLFEGTGDALSEPIRLSGDVTVTWRATDPGGGACRLSAVAARADAQRTVREPMVDTAVPIEGDGTYVLRGLPEAEYVIDVDSDCRWSFRVAR